MPLVWQVKLNQAPSIAIDPTWKMMKAKVKRTSTVLLREMAMIGRGDVRAPETESVKGAETVLEPATGEKASL